MSWPDWFGFPIFNSVDWEMRERQRNGGTLKERERKDGKRVKKENGGKMKHGTDSLDEGQDEGKKKNGGWERGRETIYDSLRLISLRMCYMCQFSVGVKKAAPVQFTSQYNYMVSGYF